MPSHFPVPSLSGRFRAAAAALAGLGALAASGAAFAQQPAAELGAGQPAPGQIGFQGAVTSIARDVHWFHDSLLLPIIVAISIFVLVLLAIVIVKFNERANPTPSKLTHHTGLEVVWTVVPVMILVVISIPSFRILTNQVVVPEADVTVKVTGKQWYWTYEYPADQNGGFSFDSIMKPEAEIDTAAGDVRLLSVDNEAVVPVGKTVRMEITAADVIHSFTIPSIGIRMDAVPGRLNQTWFKAEKEGIYYGQCSKLCGKDHAYMPIAVRVVSEESYQAWLAESKQKFADAAVPARVVEAALSVAR